MRKSFVQGLYGFWGVGWVWNVETYGNIWKPLGTFRNSYNNIYKLKNLRFTMDCRNKDSKSIFALNL